MTGFDLACQVRTIPSSAAILYFNTPRALASIVVGISATPDGIVQPGLIMPALRYAHANHLPAVVTSLS